MKTPIKTLLAIAAAVTMVASACGGDDANAAGTIRIVGFAVPEAANQAIADEWAETPEGEGVEFVTSYGASGDQSRSVESGQAADYVHFSVATDVTRLVPDIVAEDWDQGENEGIVSTSIVVFAVEKGNPLGITGWDDLVDNDEVEIVTPNPGSSGAARWNALAAWGHIVENGGTEEEAEQFVNDLYAKAVALPNSGRDATQAFLSGTGTVFLTYENEAILTRQQEGEDAFDYVIPETTLLIQNPGAVTIDATPKAQEWLDFVLSEDGQRQFALKGFRPVGDPNAESVDYEVEGANDPSAPYPPIGQLLTVDDHFGGWDELTPKFFDDTDGIVTQAIAASGAAE